MRLKTFLQYSFLLYILFVTACAEPEKPVSKEEAAALATSLTDAIAHHHADQLNELLDIEAFEKRIIAQSDNKLNRAMIKGAMSTMESGEFGRQVVNSLGRKGTYELVKQYQKANHQHLIFRLYNDKLNYHDFELIKKRGKVRIADIFIYATGENLSSTYAQTLMSLSENASAIKNVDRNLEKVQMIKSYLNRKDYEKAKELFESLPALIRNQKLYRIIYIQIASGLSMDEYLASLVKFQQAYPDAPNMYLLMIDAYYLKKDYAGSIRCINSLDSLINKDTFLDYYRALIYKQSEDHTNQTVCLERLHQNKPGFGLGTLELINCYAGTKQWDKAVPLTNQYKKSKDADTATLETIYLLNPGFRKKMETAAD